MLCKSVVRRRVELLNDIEYYKRKLVRLQNKIKDLQDDLEDLK